MDNAEFSCKNAETGIVIFAENTESDFSERLPSDKSTAAGDTFQIMPVDKIVDGCACSGSADAELAGKFPFGRNGLSGNVFMGFDALNNHMAMRVIISSDEGSGFIEKSLLYKCQAFVAHNSFEKQKHAAAAAEYGNFIF